jgi:hypothetical protein
MSNLKWLRLPSYRKELHGNLDLFLLLLRWDARSDNFYYDVTTQEPLGKCKTLDSLAKTYAEKGYRLMGFIPVPSGEQEFDGPEEKTPWEEGDSEQPIEDTTLAQEAK